MNTTTSAITISFAYVLAMEMKSLRANICVAVVAFRITVQMDDPCPTEKNNNETDQ